MEHQRRAVQRGDPVRHPDDRDDVLGEVDGGWQVLTDLLGLERTGIEFEAKARRLARPVLDEAAAGTGRRRIRAGAALVELDAEVPAGRLLSWRALGGMAGGELDDVQSAWRSGTRPRPDADRRARPRDLRRSPRC